MHVGVLQDIHHQNKSKNLWSMDSHLVVLPLLEQVSVSFFISVVYVISDSDSDSVFFIEGIGALSVPTAALFGSAEIGAGGIAIGVISAPVAWPWILLGAVVGASVGYGIPKCMEVHRKRKYRKKLKEKMIKRENKYSLDMMDEVVDVMKEIDDITKNDEINKSDLEILSIALNDLFRILDKYFYRDEEEIMRGLERERHSKEKEADDFKEEQKEELPSETQCKG